MNDTEKMGIVGTKLFWQLFTSVTFRGYSDVKLKNHVRIFKLFMYWARLSNRKMLIRKMFFDLTSYSPYRFLELFISRTNRPYHHYQTPKDAWMDVFRFQLCAIEPALGGVCASDTYNRFLMVEEDWRNFLEKNLDKI